MNIKALITKFLTNKMVLNIVSFLALFNVIGYAIIGNVKLVVYFIVFAVLIRYFSKNMTIVLGIPLLLINLFALKGSVIEGMKNSNDNTKNNTNKNKNNTNSNTNKTDSGNTNKNKNKQDTRTSQGLVMSAVVDAADAADVKDNAAQITGGDQQGFESGRRKNKGYEIDYATTIENAYDELNNILGGDGIKRLTSDTQNLMKQQMQLAEAMKGMGPVIQQIQPMVENLKGMMGSMDDGKNGIGGILDLAKKMGGGQS